jgi:enoyl-CoA hydratase
MAIEQEIFVGFCWRWRNLPKPTIVSVQWKIIAGGLMLVWSFDLIVAADDATFADPVVAFCVNGHEYFVHPYEVGARKAKQMLVTGEPLTAAEAYRLGMVNELDNMGMRSTVKAAFGLHHLGHSHNQQRFQIPVDPEGAQTIRSLAK